MLEVLIIRITTLPKFKSTLHPLYYIQKVLANNISPNGPIDHQTPKSNLNRLLCPFFLQGVWLSSYLATSQNVLLPFFQFPFLRFLKGIQIPEVIGKSPYFHSLMWSTTKLTQLVANLTKILILTLSSQFDKDFNTDIEQTNGSMQLYSVCFLHL